MAKKIGSLFYEIGADTAKLKKGLDESKGLLTQTKDKFDALKKSVLPATAIVAGFGLALSKTWDVAKEGAAMEYTIQKFDRLSTSIGTTSDALLDDLRKATKATLSDMNLTTTAADLMGLGLVKTHDQVVRLTKVVGGLGMDTNQLVLTLANQTTMRFDQLGVSVDGFDEKVKNLEKSGLSANAAFTEAFLQQAEEQLGKVGDKADTTAGKMAALEVKVENLGDAFKLKLVPAAGDFVTALDVILSGKDKIRATLSEHEGIVRKSAGSYADYAKEMQRAAKAAGYHYDALGLLRDGLNRVQEGHYLYSEALWDNGDALDYADRMARNAATGVDELGGKADDAAESLDEIGAAADTAAEKVLGLNDVDLNLAGSIESELKSIEFMLAGGLDLQAVTDSITNSVMAGTITPEQAKEMFAETYVAAQDLELRMGNITAEEAAENIANTLGVSLKDALALLDGIIGRFGDIPRDIQTTLTVTEYHNVVDYAPNDPSGTQIYPGNDAPQQARPWGGPVKHGMPYLVGEAGPEIVIPSQSGSVLSNDKLLKMLGKGGDINITVYGADDPQQTANLIGINFRAARALQGV